MQKLFLDLDGCVFNTIRAIVDLYNDDFQYCNNFKLINWEDVKSWDFYECTCSHPEYIDHYFNQPRFFRVVKMMEWCEDVLNKLMQKYEIIFVSMGYKANLVGKTIWIKDHFPNCEFIGIDILEFSDKHNVDMDGGIFIDDGYQNLKTSNASVKICFGKKYDWNYQWDGLRLDNWKEVEKYLLK